MVLFCCLRRKPHKNRFIRVNYSPKDSSVARRDFPDAVRAVIPEERHLIDGSAGQGQSAEVPWTAVFDRLITNTARQGFYIVYLFRSDLSGVYLSLNQGVTSIRDVYGADAKKSLIARAADYRARLGSPPKSFELSKISLKVPSNSLGAFYEAANICAAFYSAEALPEAAVLVQDLRACLDLYRILADKDVALTEPVEVPAGGEFIEDLTRFRWHRRIA